MKELLIYPQKSDGKLVPKSLTISGHFNVKFDSTDHFWFECIKCKVTAEVIRVFREDYYNNTNDEPRVYFYLKCPKCKTTAQRKIYLKSDLSERRAR
jgi:hypothetical protein